MAWLKAGTPVLSRSSPMAGRCGTVMHTMFTAPRAQSGGHWFGNGILRIAPTGKSWSVWLFWKQDGPFDGYYVNLEEVHRRDDRNVYSSDRVLDVEVERIAAAWGSPFCGGWEDFRPDPLWPLPSPPQGS